MYVYIVTLKIREGSFTKGFPVTLLICPEGLPPELEINSQLPPAPDIPKQYGLWQASYLGSDLSARLEPKEVFISNYSYAENCDRVSGQLLKSLNDWLDADAFRPLREKFLAKLNPVDEIRILIQTENIQLQCLPWHLVNWFEPFTKAEIAISNPNYEKEIKSLVSYSSKVRILAIIGNSEGIDTERDRHFLENLPESSVTLLVEPQRQEITEQLWHTQGWDILFFAGHSNSNLDKTTGYIYLNQYDSLTTKELKYALKKAVEKGLKIAIFNSCDGLGLARELADLKIPQILVMREPVPDKVAQEFLKYFLTAYARGESFYLAVKEARAKLQGLEDRYPCASWLPLIVQNPGEIPPTWQQLTGGKNKLSKKVSPTKPKLSVALASSMMATTAVIGLRCLGMLQSWELTAFDYLSQKLPAESSDRRILIVGADERDIGKDKYGYPLPDPVLAELIDKLQQHQPAVIGIDIFRDHAVPAFADHAVPAFADHAVPAQADRPIPGKNPDNNLKLANYWQQPNIVSICMGDNLENSVAPPQASPYQQVGFVNIYDDLQVTNGADDNVRRYLLSRSPNPLTQTTYCDTNYSFAWQLVYPYFQSKNIPVTTSGKNWQFGSQVITRLVNRGGGYQKLDDRGNQLLISYRRTPQIAQQVTIRDILEERETFDPNWIKDRIVIVGVDAKSVPDIHDTAIGEIRGLHLHAHVASQLISAVEDNRPLIWWLPVWGDWLWIGFWSVSSGLVIWSGRNYLYRSVGIGSCVIILSGVCWLVLTQGGWLAWIPGLVAIAFTTGGIFVYKSIGR
ncbi:MAG: CHASE2 domain-containing protein [Xenococcaceae cyanobacterium MO_234.B1]|nr:CHASE2 domain-containing protein [Xenococcaceae cyanobacterium MO_234.B1]